MILLAKAALGLGGTLVLAGAYTMREGVIRIDVDEYRSGGSQVHMWVPAAAIPMAMHFVPEKHLHHAAYEAREAMPILHAFVKELKKYPDAPRTKRSTFFARCRPSKTSPASSENAAPAPSISWVKAVSSLRWNS